MARRPQHLSFESVTGVDSYSPSHASTGHSSPSDASPFTNSPLSTPETSDLEDAPPLNVAGGLGPHSSTQDPTFVLVIGGLGFIGSHTVLELLRAGFNGECFSFLADWQAAYSGIPQADLDQ